MSDSSSAHAPLDEQLGYTLSTVYASGLRLSRSQLLHGTCAALSFLIPSGGAGSRNDDAADSGFMEIYSRQVDPGNLPPDIKSPLFELGIERLDLTSGLSRLGAENLEDLQAAPQIDICDQLHRFMIHAIELRKVNYHYAFDDLNISIEHACPIVSALVLEGSHVGKRMGRVAIGLGHSLRDCQSSTVALKLEAPGESRFGGFLENSEVVHRSEAEHLVKLIH